jgi:uncharacterized protein (DUF1330 family)
MKKAYVVGEVVVRNPEEYAAYRDQTTVTVAQYGGQFLARGGERRQLEGEDADHNSGRRTVIIEFASLEQAQKWYDSVEYGKARPIRWANATSRIFIVEGV